MIIRCSGCKSTFTFDTEPPKFCQECGHDLKGEETHPGDAPDSTGQADVTIAPTTATAQPGRGLQSGERIENYELISILGSGGMGVVWKAVDTKNGRQVALKRLSSNHISDQDSVTRFMREAQLASKISHPRVTFVYSAGQLDDQPYIAMELMPGETLDDRVKTDGPLQVGEAVDKILDVIDGLEAAHKMGLIHRDVKPSNCFIGSDDRVKVGDFGLSKSVISTDVQLTRTGTFMGTPAYAAPEQIRGENLDHRTDIYAVGATLCCMLTGRPPFIGDAMTVTAQIVTDVPKIEGKLPKELVRIIQICLEKNRSKRFQSLQELRNALLPFAQSEKSLAAIGRRISAYMIDIVLLAIGSVFLTFGIVIAQDLTSSVKLSQAELVTMLSWIGPVLGLAMQMVYFASQEAFAGKTIGKRLLGLKVIDQEGAKPAWYRAILRAFFIPGGAAIPLVLGLTITGLWPMTTDAVETILRTAINTLTAVIPLLLIVSPIIRRHGSEGWHEILTGTRVIADGRPDEKQLLIPVPKPENVESTFMLGPYRVGQILHHTPETTVYLGVDTQLKRNVWVHLCEDANCGPSEQRIHLSRTARQRWLDGGISDGKRWDAFEAVDGLPLQTLIASRHQADWPDYRKLMQDVAEELQIALKDGTIPESLSLPQIWLDRSGNAKIIDRSLVDVVNATATGEPATPPEPEQNAVQLIKSVGKLIAKGRTIPLSASSFLTELNQQPDSQSTLVWVVENLNSLKNKLGRIDWETRVGILGITVGVECFLYAISSAFLYLLAYFVIPVPNPSRFFIGLAIGLIMPMVVGVIFHGGLLFHLMGISVTNLKGQRVGKLKLIVRSFLSWLPTVAGTGVYLIILIAGNTQTQGFEPDPGTLAADMKENVFIVINALAIGFLCTLAVAAGVLTSIFSPTRGIQDFLLDTRLTPK